MQPQRRNLPAPQASVWDDRLEPAEPIARATAMGRDHKILDVGARKAKEDVVRKSRHSIAPNAGSKLDAVSLWVFTDLDHCRFKGSEVACTESPSLFFVLGDVLKMFNPRRLIEEVGHLSKACA